jgi:hypothetical protein
MNKKAHMPKKHIPPALLLAKVLEHPMIFKATASGTKAGN